MSARRQASIWTRRGCSKLDSAAQCHGSFAVTYNFVLDPVQD
ncbi:MULTISPECIES: hypothetical protein [unclassified Mycobacterium]|nr:MULTISPECIES: hypothetical protein [unclassified Mycobacterium]